MLYPFINAYLRLTGKARNHVFAKIAPFSLKSDNYSRVYFVEPSLSDKVTSQYHLYNSSVLAKYIETVGGTKTQEVCFITDKYLDTTKKRPDISMEVESIVANIPSDIVCKYYFDNGMLVYNRQTKQFEEPASVSVSERTNGLQLIRRIKEELSAPNSFNLCAAPSVI